MSVVHSFEKPARGGCVDAVQAAVAQFDIPFFAAPGHVGPPVAGSAPGSGGREDFLCVDRHWALGAHAHLGSRCGTVITEGKTKRDWRGWAYRSLRRKWPHHIGIRAVR